MQVQRSPANTPFQSPTDSELVKAVKAVVTRETAPTVPKAPLTKQLLEQIAADSRKGSWLDLRDQFMLVLLTAAALRESELIALRMEAGNEDVWIEEMAVNGATSSSSSTTDKRALSLSQDERERIWCLLCRYRRI